MENGKGKGHDEGNAIYLMDDVFGLSGEAIPYHIIMTIIISSSQRRGNSCVSNIKSDSDAWI